MRTTSDYFMGLPVYVNDALDDAPRMQLTSAFADNMPQEFVRETNAWMREFFGTEDQIIASTLPYGGRSILMGPRMFAKLQLPPKERA